jgi:hypothetical protein
VVPRSYFDVRDRASFTPYDEGHEFKDLDAAERMAAEAAAEIRRDRRPKGDARDILVVLKNEYCQRVLTVTVSMDINRVDREPLPPHE